MSSANHFTVDIARDLEAVSALRDAWGPMQSDPNADIDFYLTILKCRSEILRPHVILLRRDGRIETILVGRIEKKRFDIGVGYKNVALLPVRFLTLVHGGLLGNNSQDCMSALVNSVQQSLRGGEADIAWFHGLDTESQYYLTAREKGGVFTRDRFPVQIPRWTAQLPPKYEDLLKRHSQRSRYNVKRCAKLLRETFGDRMTLRSFREPAELGTMLSDLEIVASKTYQRRLGAGFINNDENRQVLTLAANQHWLRAHILYIEGNPVAYCMGIVYGKTYFGWATGYDSDFRDFRLGAYLNQKLFEFLCQEGGVDQVDFGFGDAEYKREWSDQQRQQASFYLYAPSFKAAFLNMLRTPAMGASAVARRLLAQTGTLQKIKKAWRDRLRTQPDRTGAKA